MIGKKIRKHLSITRTRIHQKKELERISKYNNTTLNTIVDAFSTVLNSNFTENDRRAFENCENYRRKLLQDKSLISYAVFGSDKTAMVKDICRDAASGIKWCEFLYFLLKKTRPVAILEIGTNLGISGCYALESIQDSPESNFITMEGLPQLCEISDNQFASIAPTSKYDIRQGLFDTTFPKLLQEDIQFDLLFVDGNHQKEPTITYFEALKNKIHSPAIFVFDDINWSKEMQEAWSYIKNDGDVNFTIDFYKQGIIVIDKQALERNQNMSLHLAY